MHAGDFYFKAKILQIFPKMKIFRPKFMLFGNKIFRQKANFSTV